MQQHDRKRENRCKKKGVIGKEGWGKKRNK